MDNKLAIILRKYKALVIHHHHHHINNIIVINIFLLSSYACAAEFKMNLEKIQSIYTLRNVVLESAGNITVNFKIMWFLSTVLEYCEYFEYELIT